MSQLITEALADDNYSFLAQNHLNTQASLNKIIEGLTNIGLEVENVKENQNNLNDFKIAKF